VTSFRYTQCLTSPRSLPLFPPSATGASWFLRSRYMRVGDWAVYVFLQLILARPYSLTSALLGPISLLGRVCRVFQSKVLFPTRISMRCDMEFLADLLTVFERESAVPPVRILDVPAVHRGGIMHVSSITKSVKEEVTEVYPGWALAIVRDHKLVIPYENRSRSQQLIPGCCICQSNKSLFSCLWDSVASVKVVSDKIRSRCHCS